MKTLSRKELNDLAPLTLSDSVDDAIMINWRFDMWPEMDEELPEWIPKLHKDVHDALEALGLVHWLNVDWMQVTEQEDNSKYIWFSQLINESNEYVWNAITSSSNTHATSYGREWKTKEMYYPTPVSGKIILPMWEYEKETTEFLKYFCSKLKYFDHDFNEIWDGRSIFRILKWWEEGYSHEPVEMWHSVLNDLWIKTRSIKTLFPF